MVLLSNSDTPFIRELYSDFMSYTREVNVVSAINCRSHTRQDSYETISKMLNVNIDDLSFESVVLSTRFGILKSIKL
jgi:site-specific DNA-adenine methylase